MEFKGCKKLMKPLKCRCKPQSAYQKVIWKLRAEIISKLEKVKFSKVLLKFTDFETFMDLGGLDGYYILQIFHGDAHYIK